MAWLVSPWRSGAVGRLSPALPLWRLPPIVWLHILAFPPGADAGGECGVGANRREERRGCAYLHAR